MLNKGDKVALVCCSNGLPKESKRDVERLRDELYKMGLCVIFSGYIFEKTPYFSGSAKERAKTLMQFYSDDSIKAIFDISGGDISNEILPYLDFEVIAKAKKKFFGYSDLTTVINAIYKMTGQEGVLYQVKNLIWSCGEAQSRDFYGGLFNNSNELWDFSYKFIQGDKLEGIVVGGNIRCLLKLAGTNYWPDMTGKVLLLESYGGNLPQMVTYFSQLKQMGVFDKICGILLGTFTYMEIENHTSDIVELVKKYVYEDMPVVKSSNIGHGHDSKAVVVGGKISLKK